MKVPPPGAGARRKASFAGLYVFLITIIMFFAGFTSAMVLRRVASEDWKSTPTPDLLWINTAVLGLSSLAAEKARRELRTGDRKQFNFAWILATLLGGGFVVGQILMWQQLQHQGVYLNSHPGSAFFYVGTIAHALHLAGGWLWMSYLAFRALRLELGPGRRTSVDLATLYWHFLGLLWLYLLWLFWYWGR
ncbi:MAG: cytochrome c oxidase subunit 3 [Bryobacteraceae bacterium]|nr:cytochrome c oxidase subunit 3 [Bryobacteraceae bacterium]MDW8378942.1 cytochrome c oxidase subunit 3 [Bryobacterales bacterium]